MVVILQNKDSRLTYTVEVSYMEIYCERVRDLLCGKELVLCVVMCDIHDMNIYRDINDGNMINYMKFSYNDN